MKRTFYLSVLTVVVLIIFGLLALGSGEDSDEAVIRTGASVDRGSSTEETVGTPGEQDVEPEQAPDETANKYSIRQEYNVNGLKIVIGEIELRQNRVLIGVTVKNEVEDTLSFYPDQGEIVMGSMQLDSNMFMTDGDVSGDIRPGVEKSAVIHFLTPEGKDVPDEDSVTLYFGTVYNMESYSTEDFIETILLQ